MRNSKTLRVSFFTTWRILAQMGRSVDSTYSWVQTRILTPLMGEQSFSQIADDCRNKALLCAHTMACDDSDCTYCVLYSVWMFPLVIGPVRNLWRGVNFFSITNFPWLSRPEKYLTFNKIQWLSRFSMRWPIWTLLMLSTSVFKDKVQFRQCKLTSSSSLQFRLG